MPIPPIASRSLRPWFLAASAFVLVASLATGQEKPARPPRVFAVVIGIADYPRGADRAIPSSFGASRDAYGFAKWLTDKAGWSADDVLMMLDDGVEARPASPAKPGNIRPTRKNLQEFAFKTWLNAKLGANPTSDDLVVLYFAGQAGQFDKGYLMATDGAWDVDEAVDRLASRGVSVLCLLDTSFYGRGSDKVPGAGDPGDGRLFLQRMTRRPGVSAWLAAATGLAGVARTIRDHSPFLTSLLAGVGDAEGRNNLVSTLSHVRSDDRLAKGGFAASGNLHPRFTLWHKDLRGVDRSPDLLLQRGHSNHVDQLGFSPAGDMLFSAGRDSALRVWRLSDRRLWRVLTPHYDGITALDVSNDGRLVAVGDGQGYVTIWDHEHRRRLDTAGVPPMPKCASLAFVGTIDNFVSRDSKAGGCWLWERGKEGIYRPSQVAKTSLAVAVSPVKSPLGFVVAETDPGKPTRLLRFRPDGSALPAIAGPAGDVGPATLATDGRRIVAGDSAGDLMVHDDETGKTTALPNLGDAVRSLSLAAGRLAVADRRHVVVHDLTTAPPSTLCSLEFPRGTPDPSVLLAPDGKAVCVLLQAEQGVRAWSIADPSKPREIPIDATENRLASLAFSPDSKLLMAGRQDGSLLSWSIENGDPEVALPKSRGRIDSLSADASGRLLLELTYDGYAYVWNLENGGAPIALRDNAPGEADGGQWISGILTPDGKTVVLAHKDRGELFAFDPTTGDPKANPPAMPEELGVRARLDKLVTARDPGSGRMAAISRDKTGFCVWNADGQVHRVAVDAFADVELDGRELAITNIDISDDGKALLVMGGAGTIAVFDIETPNEENPRQAKRLGTLQLKDVEKGAEGLCVRFFNDPKPGAPRRILLAYAAVREVGSNVRSALMSWTVGQKTPVQLVPNVDGRVHAMGVSRDGRWLTVGSGYSVEVWDLKGARPLYQRLAPRPSHLERVTSLVVQSNPPMIISGSDDTQIRFWPLDGARKRTLLGSISVDQNTGSWVAHTAKIDRGDGSQYVRFDSSIGGEIGVSWIDGDEVRTLEQFGQESRQLGLTNDLRRGIVPGPPEDVALRVDDPPRLAIQSPEKRTFQVQTASLTIALGDDPLDDLRIYQNGVPVDMRKEIWNNRREVTIPVTLVHGENRFYAMASRANAIDGRSNDVDLVYRGPEDEARLHVLAIGVGEYQDKSMVLRYAVKDATDFTNHLQRDQPLNGKDKCFFRVIKDGDVSERSIDLAFDDLMKAVRGRPQDRVVLFLAGHTEVNGRSFSLLLPSFRPDKLATKTHLPIAALYGNMMRLAALNRAVVVDACRTQEIDKDPLVRRVQLQPIRSLVDENAHRARTTYILAARQGGQLVGEVDELEHGVLTYVLLRGLNAPNLKFPPQAEFLSQLKSGADQDDDNVITSDELALFADRNVPQLVSSFPQLVQRAGRRSIPVPKDAAKATQTSAASADPAPDAFPLFYLAPAAVAVGNAGK